MAKTTQPLGRDAAMAYARLAGDVAREIEAAMEQENVSRSELATRANVDKSALTRALDGTRNLELRTIASLLGALGRVAVFSTKEIRSRQQHHNEPSVVVTSLAKARPTRLPAVQTARPTITVTMGYDSAQA
jgi:transcriptional regulator with XRE-family HTH domain